MQVDLLTNNASTIVMVDCEIIQFSRQLHAGWVAMCPGNYSPVEWLESSTGLRIGVQIPLNIRSRIVPCTLAHPTEPYFFDLDQQFAKDFFRNATPVSRPS